jgi:hypothetical protein
VDTAAQIWISVRTLGEFVFCPRAGIVVANKVEDEAEPEDDPIRLDFLPQYSLTVIEEQLALHLRALGSWAGRFVGVLIVMGVAWYFDWKIAVLIGAFILFWFGRRMTREMRAVFTLADSRRQAIAAEPKEPPADLGQQQLVNWWELLKAGFDSIRPQETMRDELTKLAGKPWRLLRKGSLRIPVIRISEDYYEGGRYWIYPQHEIRLAAYAQLVAACEGAESPYGIVLFGKSYEGVAIPITPGLRTATEKKRAELMSELASTKKGLPPPAPEASLCAKCPFGKPEKVPKSQIVGLGASKVHGRTGKDGQLYHSECGDCFGWTPPHDQAKGKGLLPAGA